MPRPLATFLRPLPLFPNTFLERRRTGPAEAGSDPTATKKGAWRSRVGPSGASMFSRILTSGELLRLWAMQAESGATRRAFDDSCASLLRPRQDILEEERATATAIAYVYDAKDCHGSRGRDVGVDAEEEKTSHRIVAASPPSLGHRWVFVGVPLGETNAQSQWYVDHGFRTVMTAVRAEIKRRGPWNVVPPHPHSSPSRTCCSSRSTALRTTRDACSVQQPHCFLPLASDDSDDDEVDEEHEAEWVEQVGCGEDRPDRSRHRSKLPSAGSERRAHQGGRNGRQKGCGPQSLHGLSRLSGRRLSRIFESAKTRANGLVV